MTLKVLENNGWISRLTPDPIYIKDQMELANLSLSRSKRYIDDDVEDSYEKAYDGAHAAGRALMAANGWKPAGEFKHLSVEKFLELFIDRKLVRKFHEMRNKRNTSKYERPGNISSIEAVNAISDSEIIISEIKLKIEALGFQL
jgi:uncharacterized protein (UPF0332 family)